MAGKGQGEHSAENGKKGGRPKSTATLRAQMMRDELSKLIKEDQDQFFSAWKDAALGHFVEVKDKDGNTTKVYKKSPDTKAIKDLFEQAYGRAPQSVDLKVEDKRLLILDDDDET